MLDNGLGPWRSRFIFNSNMQFLSKMSDFLFRLQQQNEKAICLTKSDADQTISSTYNAPIYLRTECTERKKRRGPNKKKIHEIKSGS